MAALAVMILMAALVYVFNIPNPNMILITGLTVCTALYGFGAGIVSALVMVLYSMFFFSTGHSFFSYTDVNLQKMIVILVGVAVDVVFIGNLKRQQQEANEKLLELNMVLRQDKDALEEAALTDPLTGVRNRLALTRDYDSFEGRQVHVMMIDLDSFKRLNDDHSHSVGDHVLKALGGALSDTFGLAHCYRYGGDEFLVIRPDMREEDFLKGLETIRKKLEKITLDGALLPVHFSAGYVWGVCEMSSDLRLMMHQADSNLYAAKNMGKDRYKGAPYSRAIAETLEKTLHTDSRRLF